ncbi:MAG: molybdopterin-containing oxidoreductase family protein [Pseudomonadota bacterium]
MSGNNVNRRDFLKILGWGGVGVAVAGCDRPTTVTLEEGKEEVVAYLQPEEYVIPGVGVWFASTCQQCPAGCGVHGRVREGRVLKMEGNPDSPINYGKLCQMGQAGLQGHYNPDRLKKPLLRKGGALTEVSWEEAMAQLDQKVGIASGLNGERFAWFTGTVSGHQSVLLSAHLASMGSKNHFVHEVINDAVVRAVNQDMLGEAAPRYLLDQAKVVLSFGADFVGAGASPVYFANSYAKFRTATPRGVLIQVEPKMTLTGGSADLWVAIRPGTEGVLALGIANYLTTNGVDASGLPESLRALISGYGPDKVSKITGVSADRVARIAALLKDRSPSLVLAGASAEGHAHGYQSVAAITLLNILLGNVGKTIVPSGASQFPQMEAKPGNTRDLLAFANAAEQKALDVVFFHGANPVYTAPAALGLAEKIKNIPFKVAFSCFPDETAMSADLVLPILSAHEDWGTHMGVYQPEQKSISIQQPLMEPIYPDSKGFGDLLLVMLKARKVTGFDGFEDYYAYLKSAFAALPASVKGDAVSDEDFWGKTLQKGIVKVATVGGSLSTKAIEINLPEFKEDSSRPYHLVPSARLGMWDGRHANLPWLQEAPDQISKVVWTSWVEVHPQTAAKLGVKEGDFIKVASEHGAVEAQVYIYKGVHPDVIAVPMGQGHEEYGRYAKGRGVNPLKVLAPATDAKTGELALYATRVTATHAGRRELLVKLMGNETQLGRKMVATVKAEVFNRTEGGKDVA